MEISIALDSVVLDFVITVLIVLLAPLVSGFAKNVIRRSLRRVRIDFRNEPGPVSVSHGFTQASVAVTVTNKSRNSEEISDLRIMFEKRYGIPLSTPPPGRDHPKLPHAIAPEKSRDLAL